MAKRLPKPVRFVLFGTLALAVAVLGLGALIVDPEPPAPVTINPRVWTDVAAGERIEINGYTFEMPMDAVYSRLDTSYGSDLEGVLFIREKPNDLSELFVGRISRLTKDTRIHPHRIGQLVLHVAHETREWGQNERMKVFESKEPEYFSDRYLGLNLSADVYFLDDRMMRDRDTFGTMLRSLEPIE
jgi:hypothetical protein